MKAIEVLERAYDLITKIRLLRHHEKSKMAGVDELSERELFACELIRSFAPLREWQLGKALSLQASSLNELVKKLVQKGWIEEVPEADQRQKPLKLSSKGEKYFTQVKRKSARRYWYVFHNLARIAPEDQLIKILEVMNSNATKAIRSGVFGEMPDDVEDDEILLSRLGIPSFLNMEVPQESPHESRE